MGKMNLPNKLTMLRIVLVPFFILFMALPKELSFAKYIALAIYVVASITDFLDGHIARSRNMITKFGKIMDPLADKLLVSSGFVMLTALGVIPGWITAIILFRDFTVSSLRMFAVKQGGDVAAVWSGKIKTTFQLIGIIFGIFSLAQNYTHTEIFSFFTENIAGMELIVNVTTSICIFLAVAATIWSLVDYSLKYRKYINVEE